MTFSVYKITNSISGYFYIGATTKPITERFDQHCKCKKYKYPLYNDILIYGPSIFVIELIETCDNKRSMNERETYWINHYSSEYPEILYNLKKAAPKFVPSPEYIKMCGEIKSRLSRNQRWLAGMICMREPVLSNKINDREDWTQDELDKINKVLGTSFKL